jgi:hypothetical protein
MLPCIITSFIGTPQPFNCWNQTRITQKRFFGYRIDGFNSCYCWFVDVCKSFDWEKLFHPNLSALILIGTIAQFDIFCSSMRKILRRHLQPFLKVLLWSQ